MSATTEQKRRNTRRARIIAHAIETFMEQRFHMSEKRFDRIRPYLQAVSDEVFALSLQEARS